MTPGTVLGGRFEVERVLGRGGTATVLLANDRVRGVRVALKVLHPHLADDASMRDRLMREVRAAATVRHESVLAAFDVHELDGTLALALPYHPGRTLAEEVAIQGPLRSADLASLARTLLSALAAAHKVGVTHRDVTPHNVMIGGGVPAVLTDFGLARLGTNTTHSTPFGTFGYAAPETFRGDGVDLRGDLYGLGATLWFAATGRGPYDQPTVAATLDAQLQGRRDPLGSLRPDLDPQLTHVIERLVDPEPARRPSTAAEALRSMDGAPPTAAVPRPAQPPLFGLDLPTGAFTVLAEGKAPGRAEAERLTAAVERLGGLRTGTLEPPRKLPKKFRIVRGVDAPTADRLVEQAEALGLQARVVLDRPGPAARTFLESWWVPIPLLWLAVPGLAILLPDLVALAPPGAILATVALALAQSVVAARYAPKSAPLLFARDAARREEGPPIVVQAAAVPSPIAVDPADRALGTLEALAAEIARRTELPDVARADLAATVRRLRDHAEAHREVLRRAQAARAALPAEADARPLRSRLDHLRARGDDPDGVAQIERTLERIVEAESARSELDRRLTEASAHLLEIGSVASRTHAELVTSGVPTMTTRLLRELEVEVSAADRARREAARVRG